MLSVDDQFGSVDICSTQSILTEVKRLSLSLANDSSFTPELTDSEYCMDAVGQRCSCVAVLLQFSSVFSMESLRSFLLPVMRNSQSRQKPKPR